jgi:hypothetical protein
MRIALQATEILKAQTLCVASLKPTSRCLPAAPSTVPKAFPVIIGTGRTIGSVLTPNNHSATLPAIPANR